MDCIDGKELGELSLDDFLSGLIVANATKNRTGIANASNTTLHEDRAFWAG